MLKTTDHPDPLRPLELVRLRDLPALLGVGPTTIWRLRQRGDLPEPITISHRCKGYRRETLDNWITERERAANGGRR